MLDTTSGLSALRAARSIAATSGRGMRTSIGAEKIRTASVPHPEQGRLAGAVPTGSVTSKPPSRGHRYSYLAIAGLPP
jgi:hypothetical protein